MNYFTREELEDITKELLENPTRETVKKLNEKYNGSVVESPNVPVVSEIPDVIASLPEVSTIENKEVAPVVKSAFEIPNVEVPNVENNKNNVSFEMPSFELPKLETPVVNNDPVTFSGNLFEVQSSPVDNLMQTTENFNSALNTMPTTEVPVSPVPFFGPHTDTTSNPIPVGGPVNTMPNMGPTMFGQLQQNYM